MSPFSPSMDELRAEVDARLTAWLGSRGERLEHSSELIHEMTRLLDAGGKRLRPAFCYWGFRAASGRHDERVLGAAASLELLHTFAIVHDDIMDASNERRGVPSVHALHGVDVALLVGDLALVLADDLFMECGFRPDIVAAAFRAYSRMRQEVIVGQFLDVRATRDPLVGEERARLIARLKSGRYSVDEPLAIGACLAEAGPRLHAELAAFAAPLGEAFQLRDDLLGLFGEPASTGKPIDSDIREGKRNVLYAKAVALLAGREKDFFSERWGAGAALAASEVDRLRSLVESSGARAETESLLARLSDEAALALDEAGFDEETKHALGELARMATVRDL